MRGVVALIGAAMTLTAPLSAQRERDESRLSFGLGLGATTGTNIWQLPGQPLMDNGGILDTISLARSIGASISASLSVIWFPHTNFGFSGEVMMLGGSFDTQCSLQSATRTPRNQAICTSVNRISTPSKSVSVSAGMYYRVRSRSFFSPYATGRMGVTVSQNSTLKVEAFPYGSFGSLNQVILFLDPAPRHLTPVLMFGLGFTTGVAQGYRLRWELRDHVTGFERPISTTSGRPNQTPEKDLHYEHRLSLLFGGEIMLDRRRGTRY